MPAAARASALIAACVIVAGCATRLSTPPSDSARVKQRRPSRKARTAGIAAVELDTEHGAEAALLARGERMTGMRWAGPGNARAATAGCSSSNSASACAFSWCTRRRASSVRRPRKVRKLSNGDCRSGRAHWPTRSVARAAQRSFATTAPPTTSLWPLMYLVVECTTRSAPSAIGVCSAGDRKVLSTTTSAPTAMRGFGDEAQVGDAQQRIGRRFDPDQLRRLRQRRGQCARIGEVGGDQCRSGSSSPAH